MRFFNRRRLLVLGGMFVVFILALVGGLLAYLSSRAFEGKARGYVIRELERRTGAVVTLESFGWSLWDQRIRIDGLTLRGLEPPESAPLARFRRIDIGLNFRSLFKRTIDLYELTVTQPEFHVIIDERGRTNFPTPARREEGRPLNFKLETENFRAVDGNALVNERRIDIDFELANLASDLDYDSAREVLNIDLRYDGVLDRSGENKPSIPYTFAGQMDYTRGTLLAHRLTVNSGATEVKLQGRINQVLSRNIHGKLEYTGNVQVPFLNYFFTKEKFAGSANVAGFLEFAGGYFFTRGNATSDALTFEGWRAANLRGEYAYHFPDRRLSLRRMTTDIVDGKTSGSIVVEDLPGRSRVNLDLDFANIDAGDLARVYPWDRKFRISSYAAGTLNGWFEGKFARYALSGHMNLEAYTPRDTQGIVNLPLQGATHYRLSPGKAEVASADMQFHSTAIRADGLIHENASSLLLTMNSTDLRDLAFLYSNANGSGSFNGRLTGPISKPELTGDFTLQNHRHNDWLVESAAGGVTLDTRREIVELRDVNLEQGRSKVSIEGTADLDGAPVNLRILATRVFGSDLRRFIGKDVDGTFGGAIHITSFDPIRIEGDVRAEGLSVQQRLIGDVRGHIRYSEPVVQLEQFDVRKDRAMLTGNLSLNRTTGRLSFAIRASSVDIGEFRTFGLPDSVGGVVGQADIRGDGTTSRPNVRGQAFFQSLEVLGESFPQARVKIASEGPLLSVTLHSLRQVSLTAEINIETAGYPFTARASFTQFPLDRYAGIEEARLLVTGNSTLAGFIKDRTRLRGEGRIESAETRIQDQTLRTAQPFDFSFNSDRLTVSNVILTGRATQVTAGGTIGFRDNAPLNLDVTGRVDLALIAAAYPDWFSSGRIDVDGRIGGTVRQPDLRGIARLTSAALGRRGFFTSLSNVNGELFFDINRVTLNNMTGNIGGGTVSAQGTAQLDRMELQSMYVRIETDDVRLRYPEGLRTVLDGSMVLRGNWAAPLLDGNLEIQSLSYRNEFEEFLALFQTFDTLDDQPSPLGHVRLAIHLEGSRNITIRNQLADVEARIDLDIKGTVDDPALTGHVEVSGGTLTFQGNRYQITRGNIDFIDPLRVRPVIDIQAESEIRDYRIILGISGRSDRLRLELRSDPPLPELEIVSLVAGGRTREEIYAAQPEVGDLPTGEQLFQGAAGSILFDLLQARVGRRLGFLGLDRVQVDPFLVGAGNDPVTRVTLSEQVTKDLTITYSQDLASNRQQIILIEYFISRNTSVLASRDENGALGLDLRFRKRF